MIKRGALLPFFLLFFLYNFMVKNNIIKLGQKFYIKYVIAREEATADAVRSFFEKEKQDIINDIKNTNNKSDLYHHNEKLEIINSLIDSDCKYFADKINSFQEFEDHQSFMSDLFKKDSRLFGLYWFISSENNDSENTRSFKRKYFPKKTEEAAKQIEISPETSAWDEEDYFREVNKIEKKFSPTKFLKAAEALEKFYSQDYPKFVHDPKLLIDLYNQMNNLRRSMNFKSPQQAALLIGTLAKLCNGFKNQQLFSKIDFLWKELSNTAPTYIPQTPSAVRF
jgi:hypothetical protein